LPERGRDDARHAAASSSIARSAKLVLLEDTVTIGGVFGATAEVYDRARRQLIPCFDDFYRIAVEQIPFPSDAPFRVLDLGAGTGLMSAFVAASFPRATFTLVDISEAMLEQARARFAVAAGQFEYVALDYAREPLPGRHDVVVSALSIHHLEHADKRALFRRIREVLEPGGIFVNADQALGPTSRLEHRNHEAWVRDVRRRGVDQDDLTRAFERMAFDRLSPLADQLAWLDEAGFVDVDCFYKNYRFTVYGGSVGPGE
jgi:tRNA (cmo5U34)-methyltransferase